MTRLIDANRLLKGKTDHDMISTHLIYNAPTVEAIPRERIEQILSKIPNLAHYESPDGQDLVMVSDVMRLIKEQTE